MLFTTIIEYANQQSPPDNMGSRFKTTVFQRRVLKRQHMVSLVCRHGKAVRRKNNAGRTPQWGVAQTEFIEASWIHSDF